MKLKIIICVPRPASSRVKGTDGRVSVWPLCRRRTDLRQLTVDTSWQLTVCVCYLNLAKHKRVSDVPGRDINDTSELHPMGGMSGWTDRSSSRTRERRSINCKQLLVNGLEGSISSEYVAVPMLNYTSRTSLNASPTIAPKSMSNAQKPIVGCYLRVRVLLQRGLERCPIARKKIVQRTILAYRKHHQNTSRNTVQKRPRTSGQRARVV